MVQSSDVSQGQTRQGGSPVLTWLGERAEAFMLAIIALGRKETPVTPGPETLAQIRTRQIKAIIALTPIMALANIVNASALTFEMARHGHATPLALGWWALVVVTSILFWHRAYTSRKSPPRHLASHRAVGIVVRNACLTALFWALPLISFAPFSSPYEQGLIIALTGAMLAGGTIGLYPVPLAAFVYILTLSSLGLSVVISLEDGHMDSWFLLVFAFVAVTIRAVHHHHGVFLSELMDLLDMDKKRSLTGFFLEEYEKNSDNWSWECDADLRLVRTTQRFGERLGMTPSEIDGQKFTELLKANPNSPTNCDIHMFEIALGGQVPVSGLVVSHNIGEREYFWRLHALPQHDHEGNFTGYRGFAIDVTRDEAAARRIEYLATRDALTGLLNKSEFLHRVESHLTNLRNRGVEKWALSLAFLDSDGLKAINDTFGHAAGDAMIVEFGKRLLQSATGDTMVARIGGDEFLVAEFHYEKLTSHIVSHNVWVCASLCQPFSYDGIEIRMSASSGLAISPIEVADLDRMMQQADRALYHVKQNGGQGCLLYEDRIGHPIAKRREMSIDLERAIRGGEIRVNFQPIVDTSSLRLKGYEALARWTRPDGTDISPEDFVTAAEETGQIVALGRFILNEALSLASKWENPARLSINISVLQLQYREFFDELEEMMREHGFPADQLVLEIVESKLLQTNRTVQENIERITDMGIRLAIDDFGKGYSSLAYLTEFRISAVKIDRSMTENIENSEERRSIISAIIGVARALDLTTVAEGIENAEQFRIIRDLGCDCAQGYLIGIPSAVEAANPEADERLRTLVSA